MLHSQTTDKQIQQKRIQQGITQQLTNNKQSDSETSNTAGTAKSYKWHGTITLQIRKQIEITCGKRT
jgi:hypothetical protein